MTGGWRARILRTLSGSAVLEARLTPSPVKVLIVDDDPSHLEIYALLIREAGLEPVAALVGFLGVELPEDKSIRLVLLDYKLHSMRTSAEIAEQIHVQYPGVPIVLLSDLWSMPADVEPYVAAFVRKGQPARLLETVCRLIPCTRRDTGKMPG